MFLGMFFTISLGLSIVQGELFGDFGMVYSKVLPHQHFSFSSPMSLQHHGLVFFPLPVFPKVFL